MNTLNQEKLIGILQSFNPWWETNKVPKTSLKQFRRTVFHQILDFLENSELRRTIILSGLRRVGKTTILYQLIDELLKKNIDPERIIYVSFDHPTLKNTKLDDILDIYHNQVYSGKDVYYIFDEIQYVEDWDRWLKIIYDQQPETQVIATGSANPVITKGQYESGVGRWFSFQIPTLSFFEYCELLKLEKPKLPEGITISSILNMSPFEIAKIKDQLKNYQKYFNQYLKTGGFPETALIKQEFLAQTIIERDVINKVVNSDLPGLYEIRNISDLEKVFLYICDVSSNIVSFNTISKEFTGVSRAVVEKYIKYLESANLILLSWPINLEGKRYLKAQPKIYLADISIGSAINMKKFSNLSPEELGHIVETTIYKHLRNLNFFNPVSIGYYRNSKSHKEVDIVIENFLNDYTLIEVKYRDQIHLPETEAINKPNNKVNTRIVVTKNSDDFRIINKESVQILYIPAHAFLYVLGLAERESYNGL